MPAINVTFEDLSTKQRGTPEFNAAAESFVAGMSEVVPQLNQLVDDVNDMQSAAAQSVTDAAGQVTLAAGQVTLAVVAKTAAQTAQAAAEEAANASAWVSGTTYTIGQVRWSLIDFLRYTRITDGGGTTDPKLDDVNWQPLNGTSSIPAFVLNGII